MFSRAMLTPVADEFVNFVLDQLSSLTELRAKRMFGGHGLYQGDRFFAIVMAGRLYFKTNEKTVCKYLERGMGPFIYEKARQTMTIRYYEVPPAILENREDCVAWAKEAIEAEQINPVKRK